MVQNKDFTTFVRLYGCVQASNELSEKFDYKSWICLCPSFSLSSSGSGICLVLLTGCCCLLKRWIW